MKKYSTQYKDTGGVIAISNLFPNEYEPRRGLFNLHQFDALGKLTPLVAVAPIAYFPLGGLLRRFSSSGRVGHMASSGRVEDVEVLYPRYLYPPVIGRRAQGHLYYHGVRKEVADAAGRIGATVLYGTWAYPDGFAVVKLAKELGLPCVIKVHGSDINDYIGSGWRRRVIVSTLNRASKIIAVSQALKRRMIENGVDGAKIDVIYNGVNGEIFNVSGRSEAREKLGLGKSEQRILFVGNLKPVKGLMYLIEAMRQLVITHRNAHLHIVGYGALEAPLRKMVEEKTLIEHIHFEGEKPPVEIARWMNACDLLCLPSLNEGVPNVILEAQSCGLPVVASNVGGIPEVVSAEVGSILVDPAEPVMLFEALDAALERKWSVAEVARCAERYSWATNAEQVYANLRIVM